MSNRKIVEKLLKNFLLKIKIVAIMAYYSNSYYSRPFSHIVRMQYLSI